MLFALAEVALSNSPRQPAVRAAPRAAQCCHFFIFAFSSYICKSFLKNTDHNALIITYLVKVGYDLPLVTVSGIVREPP